MRDVDTVGIYLFSFFEDFPGKVKINTNCVQCQQCQVIHMQEVTFFRDKNLKHIKSETHLR